MADLEEHALRRDKRFLVRLVLWLVVGSIAGLWIFSKLVSHDTGSCAAGMFGAAPPADSEGAPN